MIRGLMLKKTPDPFVPPVSQEQCRRLLRRVWAFGATTTPWIHLGPFGTSTPAPCNLYTSKRRTSLLRLLGRSSESRLGILQTAEAITGDSGCPESAAETISTQKTNLSHSR